MQLPATILINAMLHVYMSYKIQNTLGAVHTKIYYESRSLVSHSRKIVWSTRHLMIVINTGTETVNNNES